MERDGFDKEEEEEEEGGTALLRVFEELLGKLDAFPEIGASRAVGERPFLQLASWVPYVHPTSEGWGRVERREEEEESVLLIDEEEELTDGAEEEEEEEEKGHEELSSERMAGGCFCVSSSFSSALASR